MAIAQRLQQQLTIHRQFIVGFVSILVGAHGVFILATTLLDQIGARHSSRLSDIVIDIPLLIGLSLIYLSTLLLRRKRTAWLVSVTVYIFYLGLGVEAVFNSLGLHQLTGVEVIGLLVLPLLIVSVLIACQKEFVVRSDIQGFRWAVSFSGIMLLVALVYGVAGFSLLDVSDFHQEISPSSAVHYTIDRFDLTTSHPLHPYTKRAQLFVASLTFVSLAAVGYAAFSLFQPLRVRLSDQTANRQHMNELLKRYKAPSEDYFKLWPHDKQYFFDDAGQSGLAFHVSRGVALCLGDPAGQSHRFGELLNSFQRLCYSNDWLPALVHVEEKHHKLYENRGFSLQKIGQEAVLDIAAFESSAKNNKYFRQIRNKFTKQNFSYELLQPPHSQAVLDRLRVISDDWLKAGGRAERGYAMGYYSTRYMQSCPIMIVRDAASTIQAFINQVPASFDQQEATFDLLRHSSLSPGNINDYLLMGFIDYLSKNGYKRLNLGLCPLVGLDEAEADKNTLIDNVLRFAYANGDRFYSFSGLYRFKAKYEPEWRDRYIAYQGGVRGFSRTTTALMRSMRLKQH